MKLVEKVILGAMAVLVGILLVPLVAAAVVAGLDIVTAWWEANGWKLALVSVLAGAATYVSPWHHKLAARFIYGGAISGVIGGVAPYVLPVIGPHLGPMISTFIATHLHL